jgi:hypothetical protein
MDETIALPFHFDLIVGEKLLKLADVADVISSRMRREVSLNVDMSLEIFQCLVHETLSLPIGPYRISIFRPGIRRLQGTMLLGTTPDTRMITAVGICEIVVEYPGVSVSEGYLDVRHSPENI